MLCVEKGHWLVWVNFISSYCTEAVCQVYKFSGGIFRVTYIYTIISSSNSDILTSSFPIWIPLISFCCWIALARTSSTILNRYGESGQPCLVPDFSGIASSFSQFSLMLATGLLYISFILFRYGPQIPDLSKTFIMNGYWICQMLSPHLTRWSCGCSLSLFI